MGNSNIWAESKNPHVIFDAFVQRSSSYSSFLSLCLCCSSSSKTQGSYRGCSGSICSLQPTSQHPWVLLSSFSQSTTHLPGGPSGTCITYQPSQNPASRLLGFCSFPFKQYIPWNCYWGSQGHLSVCFLDIKRQKKCCFFMEFKPSY